MWPLYSCTIFFVLFANNSNFIALSCQHNNFKHKTNPIAKPAQPGLRKKITTEFGSCVFACVSIFLWHIWGRYPFCTMFAMSLPHISHFDSNQYNVEIKLIIYTRTRIHVPPLRNSLSSSCKQTWIIHFPLLRAWWVELDIRWRDFPPLPQLFY